MFGTKGVVLERRFPSCRVPHFRKLDKSHPHPCRRGSLLRLLGEHVSSKCLSRLRCKTALSPCRFDTAQMLATLGYRRKVPQTRPQFWTQTSKEKNVFFAFAFASASASAFALASASACASAFFFFSLLLCFFPFVCAQAEKFYWVSFSIFIIRSFIAVVVLRVFSNPLFLSLSPCLTFFRYLLGHRPHG